MALVKRLALVIYILHILNAKARALLEMGMSSAVRVSIRVRPFNRRELNANAELAVQVIRVLKISIFLNIFFAKFQNQKQSMVQALLQFITVRRRPLAMTSVSGPTQNRMLISPIRVKFSRQSALR